MPENKTTIKKRLEGTVVSDKMAKTVVVLVERMKLAPKYKKYHKVSRKFKAHDENKDYRAGDKVVIEETRPLSREKRWKVVELISRGKSAETVPAEGPEKEN